MYRYHVTIQGDKRLISTDSKARLDLAVIIRNSFSLPESTSFQTIQLWDAEFEDWVNIEDTVALPDKCKLNVILTPNLPTPSTPVSIPPSSSTLTTHSLPSLESPVHSSPVSASTHQQWPLVYSLPPIPKRIHSDLQAANSIIDLDRSTARLVIRVLFEDLIQYGWYPSSHQYHEVCQCFIRTYPNLRDRVVHNGASSSRPYQTWLSSLVTKLKAERTKLTDIPSIQAHRTKFGRKKLLLQSPTPTDDNEATSAERCARTKELPSLAEGEDEHTMSCHVSAMQDEMRKLTPSVHLIDDRMNRTLAARRKDIGSKKLDEVLQVYPALKSDAQVQKDVVRAFGHDVAAKMSAYFSQSRVDKMLNMLKAVTGSGADVKAAIGKINDYNLATQRLSCLMLLLPLIFKEKLNAWYLLNENPKTLTPILVIQCADVDRILCLEDIKLTTVLDQLDVTTPPDYLTAVTTLICMYWTFDVKIPKELNRTISFLAGHVCKLQAYKINAAAQKIINAIYCD